MAGELEAMMRGTGMLKEAMEIVVLDDDAAVVIGVGITVIMEPAPPPASGKGFTLGAGAAPAEPLTALGVEFRARGTGATAVRDMWLETALVCGSCWPRRLLRGALSGKLATISRSAHVV